MPNKTVWIVLEKDGMFSELEPVAVLSTSEKAKNFAKEYFARNYDFEKQEIHKDHQCIFGKKQYPVGGTYEVQICWQAFPYIE